MDNQHKLIKGYRDLSAEEIALMNKIKQELGTKLEEVVNELLALPTTDKRWVSIGKTDLQTGLMALVRSIAQPTSF
jgi:hypothetical protein